MILVSVKVSYLEKNLPDLVLVVAESSCSFEYLGGYLLMLERQAFLFSNSRTLFCSKLWWCNAIQFMFPSVALVNTFLD